MRGLSAATPPECEPHSFPTLKGSHPLAGADADATEAQLISSVGDARLIFKASTIRDEGITAVAAWAMKS